MKKRVIDKINIKLYEEEAKKIVDLIVTKEKERSIRNGNFSHSDSRFVLTFLASYTSEQILSKMMARVCNAEQQKLKKEFDLDNEYSKT